MLYVFDGTAKLSGWDPCVLFSSFPALALLFGHFSARKRHLFSTFPSSTSDKLFYRLIAQLVGFETIPPSIEEMRQRIEHTLNNFPWLVYEDKGELLGYAYASQHRVRSAYQWSVDVSIYIHEQSHRQGIGRKLYTALFELLREQGFYNVYAGITLPNPASVALHEAMGMQPLGVYQKVGYKLGAWYDSGWWQGLLQPHSANPPAPKSMAEMQIGEWKELV